MEGTRKLFKTGETIIRPDDREELAYVIEKGRVDILIEKSDGVVQRIGTHGSGTIIGEMAAFHNAPRNAIVRAIENCSLLEITPEDFNRRLKMSDPALQITARSILTRNSEILARIAILEKSTSPPAPENPGHEDMKRSNAAENQIMADEFRTAIGTDQLSLHYQPIVNLSTGLLQGFEALMRWNHPQKGAISPGIFIPVAEDSGLIVEASRWALREACRALRRMEAKVALEGDLYMSVNFSSTDFAEENFLDTLYTILSETDVAPHKLHLEITERLLMNQPQNAKETLMMCRRAGLGISIDDFGTGYSPLSYLQQYPIDTLKIDQGFIRKMLHDETSRELVMSIIALGTNMNMKVTAEGVEHAAEADLLKEMGCNQAQGYYFCRPHSEKDITDKLLSWSKEGKIA